jgi:hypothetical protein
MPEAVFPAIVATLKADCRRLQWLKPSASSSHSNRYSVLSIILDGVPAHGHIKKDYYPKEFFISRTPKSISNVLAMSSAKMVLVRIIFSQPTSLQSAISGIQVLLGLIVQLASNLALSIFSGYHLKQTRSVLESMKIMSQHTDYANYPFQKTFLTLSAEYLMSCPSPWLLIFGVVCLKGT